MVFLAAWAVQPILLVRAVCRHCRVKLDRQGPCLIGLLGRDLYALEQRPEIPQLLCLQPFGERPVSDFRRFEALEMPQLVVGVAIGALVV